MPERSSVHTKREILQRCLSFLADLNGSQWIKGDDPGSKDMRARAKALQPLVYAQVHRPDEVTR